MMQSALNPYLVIDRTGSNELIVYTAHGGPSQQWYVDEKGLIRSSVDDYCISTRGTCCSEIMTDAHKSNKRIYCFYRLREWENCSGTF